MMPESAKAEIPNSEIRLLKYQGFITACLLTLLLWGMHAIWFRQDTRPPVWDMALHQTYALNYLGGTEHVYDNAAKPWEKSGNYPPLVHLIIAAVFWLLHPGPHIAALANVPATFLLFWALFHLANDLAGSAAARWACLLAGLTPYLIWISRETVLDYWLSAWFVAALFVLRKTRGFESRSWSLLLGLVLGLGLLTKWFFAGILLAPLVYTAVHSRVWKRSRQCIHFLDAILIAGIVAAPWYIPNIPGLIRYFGQNAEIGALEGEPPAFTFHSFIYYLRLLEGYQLFAILFVLLLLGCIVCLRKKLIKEWGFLVAAIIGGWFVLTLLRTKDPRFTLPLVGPLLIFAGAWLQSWKKNSISMAFKIFLVALLCVQAYGANFGVSWLPRHAVIMQGYQGSMRWDWNWYLQDYFGIFGSPRQEDWKQEAILGKLASDSERRSVQPALALIPDLPWFSEPNFEYYARMRGMPVRMGHLKSASTGIDSFREYNYVLMTMGTQGMSWTTGSSAALNQVVVDNAKVFRLVDLYVLPNGDSARLYFIDRVSKLQE